MAGLRGLNTLQGTQRALLASAGTGHAYGAIQSDKINICNTWSKLKFLYHIQVILLFVSFGLACTKPLCRSPALYQPGVVLHAFDHNTKG